MLTCGNSRDIRVAIGRRLGIALFDRRIQVQFWVFLFNFSHKSNHLGLRGILILVICRKSRSFKTALCGVLSLRFLKARSRSINSLSSPMSLIIVDFYFKGSPALRWEKSTRVLVLVAIRLQRDSQKTIILLNCVWVRHPFKSHQLLSAYVPFVLFARLWMRLKKNKLNRPTKMWGATP